jgi:cytochrome c peroxidase
MYLQRKIAGTNWLIFLGFALLLSACSTDETSMPDPVLIQPELPAHFPPFPPSSDNPLTEEGVELGRRLFFDPRLSSNNKVSCATCHAPEKAFTDGIALSAAGVSGTVLHRHSPTLVNSAWITNGLFWDGGSTNLESQAFAPLAAHDEMDQNLFELLEELKADPLYVQAFRRAFADTIRSAYIVRALAQFQRTLISTKSKYDGYVAGSVVNFSADEKAGLQLFSQFCNSCHTAPLFTDNLYHNNGLDADFSNEAHERVFMGRFRISFNPADLGKFKTPTLRNIAITGPYMHDGRFSTLEQVLDHYSNNVKHSPTLDTSLMKKNGSAGIPLSIQEKNQLLAFLKTLTDSSLLRNPSFLNPFN